MSLCYDLEPATWVCGYVALFFLVVGNYLAQRFEVRRRGLAGVRDACRSLSSALAEWTVKATANPLKQGLLNGRHDVESGSGAEAPRPPLRVDSATMLQACTGAGLAESSLEVASLAVLLIVQCRRRGGSCRLGLKGSGVEEVELEKTSFAEFLLVVRDILKGGCKGDGKSEVVFAYGSQHGASASQGTDLWVACEDGTSLVVRGASLEEEKSFDMCWQACAATPRINVWEIELVSSAAAVTVRAWGKAPLDFASYRDKKGHLLPVPVMLTQRSTNSYSSVAVAGDGFSTTYNELFSRAASVGQVLTKHVVAHKSKAVILCMGRGEAVAPAFLGILAAGYEAVPVDIHWPQERILQVAAECNATVALAEADSVQLLQGASLQTFTVDGSLCGNSPNTELKVADISQEQTALVLFTSGTSGKPKGIMLSHGYLTSLVLGIIINKRLDASSKTLCYHSPTWMPFLDYLFAPLVAGGCCLFFPDGGSHVVKPTELAAFARQHHANQGGFVPAVLDLLAENGIPPTLSDIGVGGAAVPRDLCDRVLPLLNPRADGSVATLYTGYSGTEIGDVTQLRMRKKADVDGGVGMSNFMSGGALHTGQSVALLDAGFNLVGPGAVGEITVTGPGLASGYLNLPEKTAEAFLPACAALGGLPAVRSGDLGKWSDTGNLLVVGRRDTMVKVRGARIELGEVEGTVTAHPAVQTCTVTVMDDKLVAYVVPAVPADLRDYCKARLVSYMVPHIFEGLEELPRLPNGKVNKKLLPKPEEREDGAEAVMELDSLGQMRKFTRRAASEDRVLDNVRAILIGLVLQSHATPLIDGKLLMMDASSVPLGTQWGPAQYFFLQIARSGGWSSLAFLSGFDDTRAMRPYGLTYREPLFLFLWVALGFNWTMWYLPVFAFMRAAFCGMHHLGLQKLHLLLASQVWILLPAFVDFYIGWAQGGRLPPGIAAAPQDCPSQCFCIWQAGGERAQMAAHYLAGWWVFAPAPTLHSFLGHALIFIPCYWTGFFCGGRIFKVLTKIADEPSITRRIRIASAAFLAYYIMYMGGSKVVQDFDDRCSAFWSDEGSFRFLQVAKNLAYYAFNLLGSLVWVVFIASAVPVHLKYLAKVCFASLIMSGLSMCPLDTPSQALVLRGILPESISPAVEIAWTVYVPFLYELVVGAVVTTLLPIIIKPCIRATAKLRKS